MLSRILPGFLEKKGFPVSADLWFIAALKLHWFIDCHRCFLPHVAPRWHVTYLTISREQNVPPWHICRLYSKQTVLSIGPLVSLVEMSLISAARNVQDIHWMGPAIGWEDSTNWWSWLKYLATSWLIQQPLAPGVKCSIQNQCWVSLVAEQSNNLWYCMAQNT